MGLDQSIHAALALAVRLAEKEYEAKRDQASAFLVYAMRRAVGEAETYGEKQKGGG